MVFHLMYCWICFSLLSRNTVCHCRCMMWHVKLLEMGPFYSFCEQYEQRFQNIVPNCTRLACDHLQDL